MTKGTVTGRAALGGLGPIVTPIVALAAVLAAGPAAAETWRLLSSSAATGYLVDTDSRADGEDGATLITVARVPRRDRAATDLSHSTDRFAVQCDAKRLRLVESADFGPEGAEMGRYPETEGFTAVQRNSFDETVHAVACGEATPDGASWPSVRDYIRAGRPE